jgi:hypothetical protein
MELRSRPIKTLICAGHGEEKVTSIVLAKTKLCGERRDLFIWPFPFEWSISARRRPSSRQVGLDDHLAAELPQKCYSC